MSTDDVALQFETVADKMASKGLKSETERRLVLAKARALVALLETPYEKVLSIWSQSARDAAIQTCIDLNLFTIWAQNPGDKSVSDFAAMTKWTLSKHLASMHVISEAGPDTFQQTPFSIALARPEIASGITLHFDSSMPAFWRVPSYLARRSYTRPSDVTKPPLSDATGFNGGFFEYLMTDKRMLTTFSAGMQGYAADRASWLDIYPLEEEAWRSANATGPLVVDVGGGKGQDILKVLRKYPQTANRLVLQEQQGVVDDIERTNALPPEVLSQVHDFFTPQPVHDKSHETADHYSNLDRGILTRYEGARVYYFHSILHDWPDESAVKILAALKPALRKGYSKVLLNENVVLEQGTDPQITCFDMVMMSLFSSKERTRNDFRDLIERADLKLTKIWTDPVSVESILECEVP